ncbi:MAG TPA: hypothetical protein VK421_05875 [Pyrinomonadaceae bacterium]|nr:hypothetical protein [Pyrinomonadaceae bacterium]
MPELRGVQATPEVKEEWKRAYRFYLEAPGDPYDAKKDRTERINHVAQMMNLTRKQAKRRVRNYEAWQRNVKKGLVTTDATQDGAPPLAPKPKSPHQDRGQRGPAPPRRPYTR